MRMVRKEQRLEAIRAYREGKLGISWGLRGESAWSYRSFAKRHGWRTPIFGLENALITQILASDENFEAVHHTGIDIYFEDDLENN